MNNARRTYLLTLNSPSQRALRLWTGKSVHALRHCSVKEIGGALVEMQKSLDDLQRSMRALQHVKEQLAPAPAHGVGRNLKKENESLKADRRSSAPKTGRQNPRGSYFRNIRQKGDSHAGKERGRARR